MNKGENKMVIQYTTNFNVDEFPWYGGAKNVIDIIKDNSLMSHLQTYLENVFADTTPSKTQINDYVWFEGNTILQDLNIADEV